MAPASSKEFLDIQATVECGFTLKLVRDMIKTYNHPVLAEFISEEADQELRNLKNGRVNTFANHNIFYKSLSARIRNAAVRFVRAI